MQIGKAGVVAAGALATVAVMGSAAAAAPATNVVMDKSTPTTALTMGKSALSMKAPWDTVQQPLITIGVGSSAKLVPWQICGSNAVGGVGAVASASSANTVIGDCYNANVLLKQDTTSGIISILDDTSVLALPWQVCGSNAVAGVGATVSVGTPNTVTGDCYNANNIILEPDGESPDNGTLLSLLSGSIVSVAPWQVCGSSAVAGLGAVVAANSPTTVLGDCVNATADIEPRENPAEIPLLSNLDLTLLPFQFCGENGPVSLVGLVIPINSPALVAGECISHA
ncbi:hypothetical protein Rhe02_11970 [Rhizocola hellebori]|uniref:Secreted protein n=1 Tax=Rhizocola hellebori TaxID=1392758 RepID=A0A8J3VDZ5_9ACTN|nr:hypothetical protein [Rhizocola hellebori]GIH03130.1 hypothetical protein Rhe02_11970 [Rhizocola hellebori]